MEIEWCPVRLMYRVVRNGRELDVFRTRRGAEEYLKYLEHKTK